MVTNAGFLADIYSFAAGIGWVGLFRALWLGPLIMTNLFLLYLQITYLETYRSSFNSRLPLSWGEVVVRTLRGQIPSRADLADVDWIGGQDVTALFMPGVCAELEIIRHRMLFLVAGMIGWFSLPVVAVAWSALASQ